MNQKRFFSAIVFVFWTISFVEGQTLSQLIKAADKKFEEGDFYAASLYYKDALKKNPDDMDVNFKYAEACRMFNDLDGADYGYRQVVALDKTNHYPMAYFWLGEVLRSNCACKCDEAIKFLHRFQVKYKPRDYFYLKAQQEIEACAWTKDNSKTNDSIKIEHLGKEVNTPASEFNAIHVFPDRLQYSSLRNVSEKKGEEKYRVRLYNQPPTPESVFMPNGANQEMHVGNGTYTPDSKQFYFTQCEQINFTNTRCDIYVTRFENFKWTIAEKLPATVNDPAASNTHPSIGYDDMNRPVLFFSSNRIGGKGNMDIWSSVINPDGTFQEAVNAGEDVNSIGNEVTPFYDINNHKLYFSSDWHYGFGGYDVFETKGSASSWSHPQNLLQPVNTPQNDLYYSRAIDNSRAYITSNRKGSYFIEAETCCNDIYAYSVSEKIIRKTDTVLTSAPATNIDTALVTASVKAETPDNPQMTIPPVTLSKLDRLKKYVPVTLFFHNDEPGAKSLSDTTRLDYKQTYEIYSAMKSEYSLGFSKNRTNGEQVNARLVIDSFFSYKVDKGFYDLVAFTSLMLELLQENKSLVVTIKGYCSPLNYNEYNIHLGYRRVASLRNYFYHYREGILLPFISSGQLTLKNESFGEETSDRGISDDRNDKQNSVYSPIAASERRVEIISVELR